MTYADGTKSWPTLLLRYNDNFYQKMLTFFFVFSFFLHILMTQSVMVNRSLEVPGGVLISVLEICHPA